MVASQFVRSPRLAGVSPATVSRVSRGSTQVDPELRDRVLRVIEEHGYRPSHFGRALAERRHGALGLVFPGLSGPYFSELIQGFEERGPGDRRQRPGPGLAQPGRHRRDSHRPGRPRRRDGHPRRHRLRRRAREGLPRRSAWSSWPARSARRTPRCASTTAASRELTRHLLVDHGYRRLAFVGTPDGSPDVTVRWEGFLAAHRSARRKPPAEPIRVGAPAVRRRDRGDPAARRGATARRRSSAPTTRPRWALMIAALGRGIRVPEDLAITGFDDMPMASLVTPQLTTVRQPIRELATTTAKLLTDRSTRARRRRTAADRARAARLAAGAGHGGGGRPASGSTHRCSRGLEPSLHVPTPAARTGWRPTPVTLEESRMKRPRITCCRRGGSHARQPRPLRLHRHRGRRRPRRHRGRARPRPQLRRLRRRRDARRRTTTPSC